ncbi:MAG: precorrin-2 C(20)-methyltransferase [Paracoccaceae bacterium]
MSGSLFGIGVGPGDPELMTLKAHRLIRAAGVVAYPALPGVESFARSIASAHLPKGVLEMRLDIPMTGAREPAQAAYDLGAQRIAEVLETGSDVVFLCEGDPLFFGSFMYVMARIRGRYRVEVVPGVSSVSAAAASLCEPLAARSEVLTVLPATLAADDLSAGIRAADAVAIVKVGRHLDKVRAVLAALGLADRAHYVERATLAGERVLTLAEAPAPAPYFSLILITKGLDQWLLNRS